MTKGFFIAFIGQQIDDVFDTWSAVDKDGNQVAEVTPVGHNTSGRQYTARIDGRFYIAFKKHGGREMIFRAEGVA